jgi:hypothetical protein
MHSTGNVRDELTIMGLDPWQIILPAKMLTVDLAQVGYKEGILVTNTADVVVNGLDTGLEGLPNQLLCRSRAIVDRRI